MRKRKEGWDKHRGGKPKGARYLPRCRGNPSNEKEKSSNGRFKGKKTCGEGNMKNHYNTEVISQRKKGKLRI